LEARAGLKWPASDCPVRAELNRYVATMLSTTIDESAQDNTVDRFPSEAAGSPEAQWAQLEAQRLELEEQIQQWRAEREAVQQQLRDRAAELDARQAELDRWQQALEAQAPRQIPDDAEQAPRRRQTDMFELAAEQSPSQPAPDHAPATAPEDPERAKKAPVDLASVLRRIGAGDLLVESEPQGEPERTASSPPTATQPSPNSPVAAAQLTQEPTRLREGDEESIDDYMAQLMARVRGGSKGPEIAGGRPMASRVQPPPPAPVAHSAAKGNDGPRTLPSAPASREPLELSPRAAAPEKQLGFSAMRELANFSARHAITHHTRRQMRLGNRIKLLICLAGLIAGGSLLWLWSLPSGADLTFYAALVSFLVALWWGIQYAIVTGRLIVGKFGHLDWNAQVRRAAPPAKTPGRA
jgi:hypothetical protein